MARSKRVSGSKEKLAQTSEELEAAGAIGGSESFRLCTSDHQ
jgi:hypothetical protein